MHTRKLSILHIAITVGMLSDAHLVVAIEPERNDQVVDGYHKDLFMDGGSRLTSRKTFPAAESLDLTYEYFAGKDLEKTKRIQSGNELGTNGILSYPDGWVALASQASPVFF